MSEELKPCRSPYCECDKDKCTHPGFYDARGEAEYIATLPPGVIYIPTKDGGHNSREDNEAFRRAFDETNARYRAACKEVLP